jgi:hypothetical protein
MMSRSRYATSFTRVETSLAAVEADTAALHHAVRSGEWTRVFSAPTQDGAADATTVATAAPTPVAVAVATPVAVATAAADEVRRPLRPFWRPFSLRFTYVTSVLVKKC